MKKSKGGVTFSRIIKIELKKGTKDDKIEKIAQAQGYEPKSTEFMIYQVKHPVITQIWLITYAMLFMLAVVFFFAFYFKVDFLSPLFLNYVKFVLIMYVCVCVCVSVCVCVCVCDSCV